MALLVGVPSGLGAHSVCIFPVKGDRFGTKTITVEGDLNDASPHGYFMSDEKCPRKGPPMGVIEEQAYEKLWPLLARSGPVGPRLRVTVVGRMRWIDGPMGRYRALDIIKVKKAQLLPRRVHD